MTQQQFNDSLDQIMDYFKFDRVARSMELLEWKWYIDGEYGALVPEEGEIRMKVRKMLKDAYQNKTIRGGTCGFEFEFDYENNFVRLTFVLDSWGTA